MHDFAATADPGLQLQGAIIARLRADSVLASNMGGHTQIFDYVTIGVKMPYIQYSYAESQEWDTMASDELTGYGQEHTISLDCWSQYEGVKEVRNILQQCKVLLHNRTDLVLQDHHLVSLHFRFLDVVLEPDGQVYHGIAQFRAVTQQVVGG